MKPTYIRLSFGFLALIALAASTSIQAAVLVNYDMQNPPWDAPSFTDGEVSAASLVGTNLKASGTLALLGDVYRTWSPTCGMGSSAACALVASNYFSLTVKPVEGKSLTVSSLSFKVFAATAGPSARQLYVFSDKTGYVDTVELLTASTVSGIPLIPYNSVSTGQEFTIDLSGNSAFANISDSITFRFYIQTPDAGQSLAFSDIAINGSTVPASASRLVK